MNILSIDFGTSSLKLEVFSDKLESLQNTKVPYEFKIQNNDWIELDPEDMWKALRQGVDELGQYRDSIELIAYDALSPSMTFMDKDGTPIMNTITHLDRRAKEQTLQIQQKMDKFYFQSITGILPFTGGCPLTSVLWVKQHLPEVFEKTYKLGHLNSYVYKRLTGLWATDYCNASMMGMYETTNVNGGWSKEICETFAIPMEKLLEVKAAGTIEGRLCKKEAQYLGLKEGIPVALGTNDVAISQVGAGNTHSGGVLDISGSSEVLCVLSSDPKPSPHFNLRGAATPGLWQMMSVSSGGWSVEWCRKQFFRDASDEEFYGPILAEALEKEPGGTPVRFLPYLNGDRQSLEAKKGGFTDLTLDTTRMDLLAAVVNGVHEHVLKTVETCEAIVPKMDREIKLTGGLTSGALLEYKKRILPEYTYVFKENCAARGNVVLALENLARA